jgi:transcriptional regulator with XRE-family HTH domain
MIKSSDLVPARVRELRRRKGWSQEKLAEESGLSKDAVSRIERGDREPRLDTIEQIANAVGIPLSKLFDFGEPAPRASARDEQIRSLDRSLSLVEQWLADALVDAVRRIAQAANSQAQAQAKSQGRGGRRAQRRR